VLLLGNFHFSFVGGSYAAVIIANVFLSRQFSILSSLDVKEKMAMKESTDH